MADRTVSFYDKHNAYVGKRTVNDASQQVGTVVKFKSGDNRAFKLKWLNNSRALDIIVAQEE